MLFINGSLCPGQIIVMSLPSINFKTDVIEVDLSGVTTPAIRWICCLITASASPAKRVFDFFIIKRNMSWCMARCLRLHAGANQNDAISPFYQLGTIIVGRVIDPIDFF